MSEALPEKHPAACPSPSASHPLLDTETRLRLIEENVTDYAIIGLDENGCIVSWNPGAARITGYAEEEAIGQPISMLFTPEDRQAGVVERKLRQALQAGRVEEEHWHLRKDGSRFWISGTITALRDEAGQFYGYAKILRDLTERKHQEQYILHLNERLQRAMTETHHRAKNSLQQVASLVDMRLQEPPETLRSEDFRRIADYIRALAALHDLLTYESQAYAQAETVSSREWIEELVTLLEQTSGERRIHCQVQPVRLPARKASALALILNELVSNALKHSQEGDIQVTFAVQAGMGLLRVCDEGPGFPEGFHADHQANVGLGLVETLAHSDLGGQTLYANREEHTGACVTVTFPLTSG